MKKHTSVMRLRRMDATRYAPAAGDVRCLIAVLLLMILVLLLGCATPIGTRAVGVRQTYEQINVTAIKADTYSDSSADVLHRFFLKELFQKDPDKAIEILHDKACEDDRRDLLYALSELTYLLANKSLNGLNTDAIERAKSYYLASAVYAYFFLLGERGEAPPSPYDRRFRVACDLYNTALAQALVIRKAGATLAGSVRELPVGKISLELRSSRFPHKLENFESFVPADELDVYGLTVRDRYPGLGAPFIAVGKKVAGAPTIRTVPGTIFLRVDGDIRDLRTGACRGWVELYSSYGKRSVEVGGKMVPLEDDLTAQLAYSLNQPFFWDIGMQQFLKGQLFESGIFSLQPYSPDRIPVLFVHGTLSSPVGWAEMFNTLRSDPVLREKYQFWFYMYDSSKPIIFSAMHLRESLSQRLKDLDPEGKDTLLKQMVIVGHSQGGLLTKATAMETGDAIVRTIAHKRLDELHLSEAQRELVRRYLVNSPLPFVSRVIFISTPHRGSYLARDWILRLVKKFVSLPRDVVEKMQDLVAAEELSVADLGEVGDLRTSLDTMSPKNPGLLAVAEIPLGPGIKGHSIIAIKGDEDPPEGDDGVVTYKSAHIDYVESEFRVRSGHSCRGHPLVIEEVRRILLKHLKELPK